MTNLSRPKLSHLGIFVRNIDVMERFYTSVFGLAVTDRGVGKVFRNSISFLSGNPEQHHQLVLSAGRAETGPSTLFQISFMVSNLTQLRSVKLKAEENGGENMRFLNHGNSWSVYFDDPEENTVEVYMDTPFHTPQPCAEPLNLDLPDEQLLAETKALVDSLPGAMPREDYVNQMKSHFNEREFRS